jgi:hypothetical protein
LQDGIDWRSLGEGTDPILIDTKGEWATNAVYDQWPSGVQRGYPLVFAVGTADMKVWNDFIGWPTANMGWMYTDNWLPYVCSILDFVASKRGV